MGSCCSELFQSRAYHRHSGKQIMIDAAEFAAQAKGFAAEWSASQSADGDWAWCTVAGPFTRILGSGYLAMRKRIQLDNTTIHLEECGSLVHDLSLPENKSPGRSAEVDSESAVLPSSQTASFEYHIVYHPSYRVPVLYFNAFDQAGQPLEYLYMQAAFQYANEISTGTACCKWSDVTSEEHPILKRPFFLIHPCRTAEVMRLLKPVHIPGKGQETTFAMKEGSGRQLTYMAAWFSIFGPTLALKLPSEMWTSIA